MKLETTSTATAKLSRAHAKAQNNNDNIPDAAALYSTYGPITLPQITTDHHLTDWFARETPYGDLAVGIVNKPMSVCSNLTVVRRDGKSRFLHDLRLGEYSPCSCYLSAGRIVAAESYLSALAIAGRTEYKNCYVVACFCVANICQVLIDFADRWPSVKPIAAPDQEIDLPIETIRPPKGLTWLSLHQWEVERWAA